MEKTLKRKSNFVACVLIFIVVCLGIVFAGDVIVKEGLIEGEKFQSTGCTATGPKAVAFGYNTTASGDNSTAMGYSTTAGGHCSIAIGYKATASGPDSIAIGCKSEASGTAIGPFTTSSGRYSTAMGYGTTASGSYSSAFGKYCTNDIYSSFAVGNGLHGLPKVDFRVESGLVTVGNLSVNAGDLYVGQYVYAVDFIPRSPFYDKDTYGKALDYAEDSSKTIKVNAQGQKEYNHEADPVFLKKWVAVKDYDKYTDKQVWNEDLQEYEPVRIYKTHQELGTSLGMEVAWLRQCVYELKQENQMLKDQLQTLKDELYLK